MRRLNAPLDDWTAADVLAIIAEQVEEGQRLEYKRELDLSTPKQRREAAKDGSGLANAQGGLLIYGIEEEAQPDGRRIPVRPTPLRDGDARSRLEDILDSSVTPTLNFDARQLETADGYFLVIRIFPRLGVPHMVDAYDDKRCYVRAGLKTRPMEQHELTAAYAGAAIQARRAVDRLRGLPLIARPEGISLTHPEDNQRPGPWISVLTLPVDAPDPLLPMLEADQLAFPDDGEFERWGRSGPMSYALGWDALGYMDESSKDDRLTDRIRLYRNGVFEWGKSMAGREDAIPAISIAQYVHDVVGYFTTSYRRAGYFGRLRIWVSLEDAEGTQLGVGSNFSFRERQPLAVPHLEWRGDHNVDALDQDLSGVTRAAMDRIWVAYGFSRCPYFTESGEPTDEVRR